MIQSLHSSFRRDGIDGLSGKSSILSHIVERQGLDDYVMLSTCNRAELYTTCRVSCNGFTKYSGRDSVKHLFRVSAGIDSMLMGETEILSQVRRAWKTAHREGHCSQELSDVFKSAARFGARARAKTTIGHGRASIASLSVEYALNESDYCSDEVLVIGSGSMGEKIAVALKNKGVKQIFLANRRRERASRLAERVGGEVVDFERLREHLEHASIVFSATSSPHSIIRREHVNSDCRILFVDLGVPADVSAELADQAGIKVVGLDYFEKIARDNNSRKAGQVQIIEDMMEKSLGRYGL